MSHINFTVFYLLSLVIIIILGNEILFVAKLLTTLENEKCNLKFLLLSTHLEAQQDCGEENDGWALEASLLLLDNFLSDR